MARRKSRKATPTKRVQKLDTVFPCPFCSNCSSVECRIDIKNRIGEAICCECRVHFATTVTHMTEPVDIYSEWIDECEKVNTAVG